MSNETTITIVGNLVAPPELRFQPSGAAVANFTIASTPRTFDKATTEWKDGDTLFMRCSIWREYAENVAESLIKGMAVIAQGNLVQRSFETREGEKRTVVELQVTDIGPTLKYATAKVMRSHRGESKHVGGQPFGVSTGANRGQAADPWATPPAQTFRNDEPPF